VSRLMIAAPLISLAALAFAERIGPVAVDVLEHADRCSISREISEAALPNCQHEMGR
jgi:hypothetical protein